MYKLLRRELKIWLPSKVFKYGILTWFLCSIAIPLLFVFAKDAKNFRPLSFFQEGFEFPIIINTMSVFGLLPLQILIILLISIVCNELEFNISRLHIINGSSRFNLWKSKVFLSLFFAFINVTLTFILAFCVGDDSISYFDWKSLKWLGILFFQSFFYLNVGIFISLIFKRSGTSILIYLLWFGIIERIIIQLFYVNFKFYSIIRLLPGRCVEDMSYFQILEGIAIMHNNDYNFRLFFCFLWLFLLMIITFKIYNKKDF